MLEKMESFSDVENFIGGGEIRIFCHQFYIFPREGERFKFFDLNFGLFSCA